MKKLIFTLICWAIFLPQVQAQKVTFQAQAPKRVLAGNPFQFAYVLNTEGKDFQQGDFGSNVTVLQGPSLSTSSSIQIVNGQMSRSMEHAYIFYLRIDKEGVYTLPKATVSINGDTYTSTAVSVEVVKNPQPNAQNNQEGTPTPEGEIAENDLFLRLQVNKANVFVGEPVVATLKVYTRVSLAGYEDLRLPPFNGLWKEELELPQQVNLEREEVNGVPYNVGTLKQYVIFPQRAGQLHIDQVEMDCIVRQQQQRRRDPQGDPFGMLDEFFGGRYQNIRKSISSPPVKLQVKALPSPQPAGFSGAVGDFHLEASLDKTSIKANEPINLKLKISGTGNLKLAEAPKLQFPADFEVYDPKASDALRLSTAGYSGSKTLEYLVIPRSHGSFDLSELNFAFFNPQKGTYETRTVGPFHIEVERGEGVADAPQLSSGLNQEGVSSLGEDIHYLKTGAIQLREKGNYFFGSTLFYLGYLLPVLVFIGFLWTARQKRLEAADVVGTKHRQAGKMAKKRLEKAAVFQKENKKDAFYKEVLQAINGYLGDKLVMQLSDLNRDRIRLELQQRGVEENTLNQLFSFMDTCEFAQFAPAAATSDLAQIYDQAALLIGDLDTQLKARKVRV
jgi:BatD DUF11 like domain